MSARRFPPYPGKAHQSGQAKIKLAGKTIYLGAFGSDESWDKYRRLLAEWQSAGPGEPAAESRRTWPVEFVEDLIERFWGHAKRYYSTPDGKPSSELENYRATLRPLRVLYGKTPIKDFGPIALKALRQAMLDGSWLSQDDLKRRKGGRTRVCRKTTNQRISRIVRMFKWGVSEELIAEEVHRRLAAVGGLRAGKTDAIDYPDVEPVDVVTVEKTLPFLGPIVGAMVRLQLYTGMRPGEVCALTPGEIDRDGLSVEGVSVWVYRPAKHKTAHRGHKRAIVFGPKAQEVLRPLLEGRAPDAFVFSPAEAVAAAIAEKVAKSNTHRPVNGTKPGPKRKRKRPPGAKYRTMAYATRIRLTCDRHGIPRWHPHRLRHTAETLFEGAFDLDTARAALGHRDARMTIRYGKQDLAKAAAAAAKIG